MDLYFVLVIVLMERFMRLVVRMVSPLSLAPIDASVDQYTWTIADKQERYDYGRRILEKAMVYGRLASSFPSGEWVRGVEEDKRRRVDFTEAGMCIIDHSRNICIIGCSLRLVLDCVLGAT